MKSFEKITLFSALVAFILSFSFSASHAQDTTNVPKPPQAETYQLKGKVVDAQTAEVLANAEIAIESKDIRTVSSEEGKFTLKNLPAGKHTVKVKLDGYQTWQKKLMLEQDSKLEVKLKPER